MVSVARVHSIRTINVYIYSLIFIFPIKKSSLLLNRVHRIYNRIFSIHFYTLVSCIIYISLLVQTISFDWFGLSICVMETNLYGGNVDGIFTRVVKVVGWIIIHRVQRCTEEWWKWMRAYLARMEWVRNKRDGIVFSRNNYCC